MYKFYGHFFTFSKKEGGRTRQLSSDELKDKVKLLVLHAYTIPQSTEADSGHVPILVSKTVKHKFSDVEGEKWWMGKVISQVSCYYQTQNRH